MLVVGEDGIDRGASLPRCDEGPASIEGIETLTLRGTGELNSVSLCPDLETRGVVGLSCCSKGKDEDLEDWLCGRDEDGEVMIDVGRGEVAFLDLGPFRKRPRPLCTGLGESLLLPLADREGSCDEFVAAVRVSTGGGLIGAAMREDVVEEVVLLDREDDVEALRWTEGDVGKRGKAGKGGVGGAVMEGVGTEEARTAAAAMMEVSLVVPV